MPDKIINGEPIEDNPIEEIPVSPEDELEIEISKERDAEQYRCYDLTRPCMPIKYITTRSERLNQQVAAIPKYYEVQDKGEAIGYQMWEQEKIIQVYGVKPVEEVQIIGIRQRGE